jgi:DNA-binding CsgD family transcriptional regulator
MREVPCRVCKGARLKPTSLAVTVGGKNISEVSSMSIDATADFLGRLELSERERQVAHLVASGLSNAETAARLYVSRKAVEFHLTNVYLKLGISSRRALASELAATRMAPVRSGN